MHASLLLTLLLPVAALRSSHTQEPSWEEALLATIPEALEPQPRSVPSSNLDEWVLDVPFVWSTDGRQVAWVARYEDEWRGVLGDRVVTDLPFARSPGFAGEDAVFAIARSTSESTEEWWVQVGEHRIGPEDWLGELAASADGRRIAYWTNPGARVGNAAAAVSTEHFLALAERREREEDWRVTRGDEYSGAPALPPRFDAEGRLVTTLALSRDGWLVLQRSGSREKELSDAHPAIRAFAVARDDDAVAFVVPGPASASPRRGKRGTEGPALHFGRRVFDEQPGWLGLPAVDARGKQVAYAFEEAGRRGVAIGEERGESRWDHVLELAFDPTGETLAAAVNLGGEPGPPEDARVRDGESFVVLRPTRGRAEELEGPRWLEVRHLTWDAHGERLAYCARDAEGWRVVCGEVRGPVQDEVGPPRFSPDGERLGYGARVGRELWWRVLTLAAR